MNTANTTANNAVETVEIPASVFTKKRVALSLGLAAIAGAAFYGYKMYKAGKVVIDVVTEAPAETPAEEAPAAE